MQFGFCTPIFAGSGGAHSRTPLVDRIDYDELERIVQEAEALGYDSFWVADHLMLGSEQAILEGWTVMAALSRVTSRMRIGSIHLANRFRHPAITAKMAATLDVISGGRLDFFFDPYAGERAEAVAYGLPDQSDEEAYARFAEALELSRAMWSGKPVSYNGTYYSLDDAACMPQPVQTPSIPLWIGAFGSHAPERQKRTAELISTHADWWNITPASKATVSKTLDVLKEACAGRGNYESIGKSLETQILVAESQADLQRWQQRIVEANPEYGEWDALSETFIIGDVATVRRRLTDYADLGISYFMFWFMDYPSTDGLRLFAEKVMPEFQ